MRILRILLFLTIVTLSAYGQQKDTTIINKFFNKWSYKYSSKIRNAIEEDYEFKSMDVKSQAGDLVNVLGEYIYNIDSLVVRGTINDEDINTLWDASFNGRLTVINLENAEVISGIIPEDAFWHYKEQIDPSGEYIYTINLKRIILPEGIKRIEDGAFMYAVNLEEINIPSALQYLGTYAFADCVNLKTNPLVFPEGFEQFGQLVFSNCRSLTGQIVLPTTIKEIGVGAFFQSKISAINLPEGLKRIDDAAFYACCLKEIWIPNTCLTLSGSNHFKINYFLEKLHLPEGLDTIPNGLATACLKLQEVNIPSSVKSIGHKAFQQCESLKEITLPNGLENIEYDAFYGCDSLEQIIFPTSLKTLGESSCTFLKGLKRIYCMASEPATCKKNPANGSTPFGSYDSPDTPNDIPIYVPVGTAEKYRKAWGWDYFTNFIETDDFPATGIRAKTLRQSTNNHDVYDLSGRKVTFPQKGQVYIINGKKVVYNH